MSNVTRESSVSELQLSKRAEYALEQAGVRTVGELLKLKEYDLLKHKHCGRKTVKEIREELSLHGFALGIDATHDETVKRLVEENWRLRRKLNRISEAFCVLVTETDIGVTSWGTMKKRKAQPM